jgi:hypothetical protein
MIGFEASKSKIAILCDAGGMGIAAQQNVAKRISDAVEQYVKSCLGRLEY